MSKKVIVVGAGSFGSWCAWNLLSAGHQVALIDAWGPGNSRSSSGGETRVIRTVYGTDDIYIEMAKRSFEIWQQVQNAWYESLLEVTGSLWLCGNDDSYVESSRARMESLGLALQRIPVAQARKRWPVINFEGIDNVLLEPTAGFLRARFACEVLRNQFIRMGGSYLHEKVEPISEHEKLDEIQLSNGRRMKADHYVFACGPWLKDVFPETIGRHLQVSRQEVYYFGTPGNDRRFEHSKLPVWLELGSPIYYGIPSVDQRGFKLARDERGSEFDPTCDDRNPTPELLTASREFLAQRFPLLAKAPLLESRICQYTNTPDGHFLIDQHSPSGAWVVGGGSGHGFKMGPAIGEMVNSAVTNDVPLPQIFSLKRLAKLEARSTQFDHSN